MALPREAEGQRLAAGRVIVRHDEGRLALSSFRFFPLGRQAALGAEQPVFCVLRFACLPIRFACAPQRERHVAIVSRLLKQGGRTIKRCGSLGRVPLQQEDASGESFPGGQQHNIGHVILVRLNQCGPGARRVVLPAGDRSLQQRGLNEIVFVG